MSRGISRITLYENKGITFQYDENGVLGAIAGAPRVFVFNNCDFPEYTKEIKRNNGRKVFARELKAHLKERSEFTNVRSILRSWYGWITLVESFYDTPRAIIDPLFLQETNENYQQGVNYELTLEHYVDSDNDDVAYSAENFITFDNTEISWDSTEITWDQITFL